jgi:hypothetical protein
MPIFSLPLRLFFLVTLSISFPLVSFSYYLFSFVSHPPNLLIRQMGSPLPQLRVPIPIRNLQKIYGKFNTQWTVLNTPSLFTQKHTNSITLLTSSDRDMTLEWP